MSRLNLLSKTLAGVCAAATLSFAGAAQAADDFPNRPVTIVVPYAAGGSNDLIARLVGAGMSPFLGNNVVVVNAPGASGTIGASRVVNAAPDGYTILLGSPSEISIAHQVNTAVKYDGERDLAPIGQVGSQPLALVAAPNGKIKDVASFMEVTKTEEFRYGTSGIATPLHLAGELIAKESGGKMYHVPYKGGAPAITDIMGGQTEGGVLVFSTVLPHIRSGALRGIGVTSAKRAEAAPDLPALAETPALKGVDIALWFGLWAPAKTDPAIIDKLSKALEQAVADPATNGKLKEAGLSVEYRDPKSFKSYIAEETVKFGKIAKDANVQAN